MNVSFTDEERSLLSELLDRDYRELKEEINKTEAYDFKENLKARERQLVALMDRIGMKVGS